LNEGSVKIVNFSLISYDKTFQYQIGIPLSTSIIFFYTWIIRYLVGSLLQVRRAHEPILGFNFSPNDFVWLEGTGMIKKGL